MMYHEGMEIKIEMDIEGLTFRRVRPGAPSTESYCSLSSKDHRRVRGESTGYGDVHPLGLPPAPAMTSSSQRRSLVVPPQLQIQIRSLLDHSNRLGEPVVAQVRRLGRLFDVEGRGRGRLDVVRRRRLLVVVELILGTTAVV